MIKHFNESKRQLCMIWRKVRAFQNELKKDKVNNLFFCVIELSPIYYCKNIKLW